VGVGDELKRNKIVRQHGIAEELENRAASPST